GAEDQLGREDAERLAIVVEVGLHEIVAAGYGEPGQRNVCDVAAPLDLGDTVEHRIVAGDEVHHGEAGEQHVGALAPERARIAEQRGQAVAVLEQDAGDGTGGVAVGAEIVVAQLPAADRMDDLDRAGDGKRMAGVYVGDADVAVAEHAALQTDIGTDDA